MTQRFGKFPKYLGNGLHTWDRAQVFEKRFYCVGNGLRIGKWLRSVGNGSNMWGNGFII